MRAPAGLPLAAGWWEDLESRWSQPPRAYHSIDHLREVLGHWGEVDRAGLWADRLTSFAALCLHDAERLEERAKANIREALGM
ncbi:MAG: hypothetical protein VX899_22180 [Myxococcota bacterium]|nr:hypothetical protein [Myxococcota bacterium]